MQSSLGQRPFRLGTALLLLGAALAMAAPALQGEPLNYDDQALLHDTGSYETGGFGGGALDRSVRSLFTGTYYYAYLPFYGLSYKLDDLLFRGDAVGFHLGNVLWHAAAGFVLFCVLGLLLRNRVAALIGALLFVLHPLHVESVAWIAGRKEVLSAFFFFLAWLLFLKAEDGSRAATVGALLALLVACFTKATAVVLPGFLLMAAWLLPRYDGARRRAALRTVPFCVVALAATVVHLLVAADQGVVSEGMALDVRVAAGFAAWGRYLVLTALPFDLSVDYPEARPDSLGSAWIGIVLVGTALFSVFLFRRRAPLLSFAVALFLVALAPFNNVFPASTLLQADRYTYLALSGAAVLAGWAVLRWRVAAPLLGLLAAVYLLLSMQSAGRFESDKTLWTRTIEVRPGSAIAHINLGFLKRDRGLRGATYDEQSLRDAVGEFEKGLELAFFAENRVHALSGLIECRYFLRQHQDVLRHADEALEILAASDNAGARRIRGPTLRWRGLSYAALGRLDRAVEDLQASVEISPQSFTYLDLGKIARVGGWPRLAVDALQKASGADPSDPEPEILLGQMHRQDKDLYRRHLEEARRRAPQDARVVTAWADFWLDGDRPDPDRALDEAARLPAGSAERSLLEARIGAQRALFLFRHGRLEEALESARAVRRELLRGLPVLQELGSVFLEGKHYDDAIDCYRGAPDTLVRSETVRGAIARAYTLKAAARWTGDDIEGALSSMQAALDERPALLEAGAAPLRRELDALRATKRKEVRLLAVAAVVGDLKAGEEQAGRALDGDPTDAERILTLQLRALLRGFSGPGFEGADEDLAAVLALRPGDAWTRFRRAQIRARGGGAWLRTAVQTNDAEVQQRGERLLRQAIDELSALLAEDPDFHLARLARGAAYFALQDLIGAKADFSYVAARDPSRKEVYLNEAALHRLTYVQGGELQNLYSALEILRKALALDPNYFDALFEMGNLSHLLFDRPSARRDRLRAYNAALRFYKRAMAVNPRSRAPRVEYAALCLKVAQEATIGGKLEAADKMIARAEERAGDVPAVPLARARLNLSPGFARELKRSQEDVLKQAEEALLRARAALPGDPRLIELEAALHNARGWFYFLGHIRLREPARKEQAKRLAVEHWKKALELDPEGPESAGIRQRLRELVPEDIEVDRAAAQAAFDAAAKAFDEGRFADAERGFRKASSIFPDAELFIYNLGLALARQGKDDAARSELHKIANSPWGAAHPQIYLDLVALSAHHRPTAHTWLRRYVEAMQKAGKGDDPEVERAKRLLGGRQGEDE